MNQQSRILSAMRPSGGVHLGHYYGVIENWLSLQYEHDCYFMVADYHALITNHENNKDLQFEIYEMVIDWLACGVDPSQAVLFVQSHVPQHAELHLLLSILAPLSWLERIPTYREQVERLAQKDLETYGFLGYPLLQSADILLYKPLFVPVGDDQVSHVELTREIARRFNHIYGREIGFEDKAREIIKKLGSKKAELYSDLLIQFQQNGNEEAELKAKFLLKDAVNLSLGDKERLFAFLENKSRVILNEPQDLLSETSKLPGLDGHRMSKSQNNTILLREDKDSINKKIKVMQTDPARIRLIDPGNPDKCPVWQLHQVYSDSSTKSWVKIGCTTAGIGCLECKQPVIDAICQRQEVFLEKRAPYTGDYNLVKNILADGAEKATETASATLDEVKQAMNIDY